jgi:hypothetical protein
MRARRARSSRLLLIALGLGTTLLAGYAQADGPAPGAHLAEPALTAAEGAPAGQAAAKVTSDPTRARASRGERYRSTGPVVTSGSGRTFVLGGSGNWWGRLSSGLR